MTALFTWLMGEAVGWIAGALVLLIGALGLYAKGRKDTRRETALEAAEREAKTRKKMEIADETTPSDPAVLRDWLRERGERPGDL